jgi:tRNA (Thr-GGU) A37 N-methylase
MTQDESTVIRIAPIGWVRAPRAEARDDCWGAVTSTIELDERFSPEALAGLADFSHLEVVYQFHGVPLERIETAARHPRNREDLPQCRRIDEIYMPPHQLGEGIFAIRRRIPAKQFAI